MRWIECGRVKITAQGRLPHRVWVLDTIFWAETALERHGPYQSSAEARRECERRDKECSDE